MSINISHHIFSCADGGATEAGSGALQSRHGRHAATRRPGMCRRLLHLTMPPSHHRHYPLSALQVGFAEHEDSDVDEEADSARQRQAIAQAHAGGNNRRGNAKVRAFVSDQLCMVILIMIVFLYHSRSTATPRWRTYLRSATPPRPRPTAPPSDKKQPRGLQIGFNLC